MRFSVVIPVYNVERYLAQCLKSVQAQTFDDFEVVVVNDGSTDGSLSICKAFANDSGLNVRLIDQRNKGLLMARRAGLDVAIGEYAVCLDSDDALRVDALEKIDSAINRTNADVLLFQASRSESYETPYFDYSDVFACADNSGVFSARDAHRLIATTHNVHSMWGKAIRRDYVGQGTDFTIYEGLQYGEDLLQTTRRFDSSEVFAAIPDILYFYRDNHASISHHVNRHRLDDIETVRAELLEYARRWDESYCPIVMANSCVETLAYCLMCVNRLEKAEARDEICGAVERPFFKEYVKGADLSLVPGWKRLGIKLLSKRRFNSFMFYIRSLFGLLRIVGSEYGKRYL